MKITALIPCAGNGTRMYPWTTTMSKEMLPVPHEGYVLPAVHSLVSKINSAGISDVRIVISENKRDLVAYFQQDNSELIKQLINKGKRDFANQIKQIPVLGDEKFILQEGPYGNATPLLSAIDQIPEENWILYLFPDDLFLTKRKNEVEQILLAHQKYGGAILPSKRAENDSEKDKYAFSEGQVVAGSEGKAIKVKTIIEKPGPNVIDSDLASVKGYLLPPEIRQYIKQAIKEFDGNGEFMIQPIIQKMIDEGFDFFAVKIDGEYHDTGNSEDYCRLWSAIKSR